MGIEIERKFLLKQPPLDLIKHPEYICQGYISSRKSCTIRVRMIKDSAFLTIKGITTDACRSEYEYPIPVPDAQLMLKEFCPGGLIEKNRYTIQFKGFAWEIDQFLGANDGLWVAEIELETKNQKFKKPDWLSQEVTGDPRYYNSNLVSHPYGQW